MPLQHLHTIQVLLVLARGKHDLTSARVLTWFWPDRLQYRWQRLRKADGVIRCDTGDLATQPGQTVHSTKVSTLEAVLLCWNYGVCAK